MWAMLAKIVATFLEKIKKKIVFGLKMATNALSKLMTAISTASYK
jgi:hypothetical protein